MLYEKYLKDNTCFIVPSNIKEDILFYISKNKLLIDVCFYTMDEVKRNLYFDYNEKTIYEVSKKYNLSYDDSKLMINNLYYLNDSNLNNEKINKLKEIKEYLLENKFLTLNKNFLSYLTKKEIVTSYNKTTFFNEMILSKLNNITYMEENCSNNKEIYEFNFIDEEVEFVAYSISILIDQNIDINKIKLVNVSEEYLSSIKKIFTYYNLVIDLNEAVSLYDLNIIKDFISILKENDLENTLTIFKEKYPLENSNNLEIYNKIIQVLNKHYFIKDYATDLSYLIKGFQNTYLKEKRMKNCLKCLKLEEITNNDNYYFLIGFNSRFPKYNKDEDYLSDDLKKELGFKTSNEINKYLKEFYLKKIKTTSNLTISYKLKDYFNSYLISPLINDLDFKIIKDYKIDLKTSYSIKYNEIKLAKCLDNYYKFSQTSDELNCLLNNYNDIKYNKYDNSFKGIDSDKFLNYINHKLSLSYSSLDTFYKCHFRYYLEKIIHESDDNFYAFAGTLYHQVLSKMYDEDFDFDIVYNTYLNTRELTSKEEVLLMKLKEELERNILVLNEQIKKSSFKRSVCEKNLSIEKKSKASILINGCIDKIMISDDNKYAYVVDYKTGNPSISFNNIKDGLGMQLAIYMYLMRKSKEYADIFLVGCYLQKILQDDLNKEEIKLEGYTYDDLSVIGKIDNDFDNKSFISGIKVKKDGSLAVNDKLYNKEYYESVIETVEEKIEEAIKSIENSDFKINPKIVKGERVSCRFCKFKDICYHEYKDYVVISQDGD